MDVVQSWVEVCTYWYTWLSVCTISLILGWNERDFKFFQSRLLAYTSNLMRIPYGRRQKKIWFLK